MRIFYLFLGGKFCILKNGYSFLFLLLTIPIFKYRGLDETVTLTDDAIQIYTTHGNIIPYYGNSEAFHLECQLVRQLCAHFSATLVLCMLNSIEKLWYQKVSYEVAVVFFDLTLLCCYIFHWINVLGNDTASSPEQANCKPSKRKSSEGTPISDSQKQSECHENKDDENSTPPEKRGWMETDT